MIVLFSPQFNMKLDPLSLIKIYLQKSRLVIDVNEKVTVLDEVVVGPENTEKFLDSQRGRVQKNRLHG